MKTWKAVVFTFCGIVGLSILSLALLIGRGFRATSMPTSFERVLARRVRNFAIPLRERIAKSPVTESSESLRKGRENSWHGVRFAMVLMGAGRRKWG